MFDGNSASAPPLLCQYTGPIAPAPITSSGNSLYLWFLSVDYETSKGIVAMVTFLTPNATLATPTPLTYAIDSPPPVVSTTFRCGPFITSGSVNASGSTIATDPSLPPDGSGPANLDCSVLITAPPDEVVALSYVNYSLAQGLDYWSVFDGSSAAAAPLTFRATGALALLPPVVVSTGSYLFVAFQSSAFVTGVGRGGEE